MHRSLKRGNQIGRDALLFAQLRTAMYDAVTHGHGRAPAELRDRLQYLIEGMTLRGDGIALIQHDLVIAVSDFQCSVRPADAVRSALKDGNLVVIACCEKPELER